MDFFQHRYYKINQITLKSIGQWPYQSTLVRIVLFVATSLTGASQMLALLVATVKHRDDWNFLVECATALIFDALCTTKYFSSTLNLQKMLKLLNRIRIDWEVGARDRDVDIFHEYAEKGRKYTILYGVIATITWALFMTQPIIPKIIDILLRNGTEPIEFPNPVDYHYFDAQKYYVYVLLHLFLTSCMGFLIVIACDTIFIVFVQHSCGLFAALGRKLNRIGKIDQSTRKEKISRGYEDPDAEFKHLIVSCINRHTEAIQYAELIEEAYKWCVFIMVGMNMILISITGLQIFKKTIDPKETIRYIVCNVVAMIHLYVTNHMAQILMDHSIAISDNILNGEWYRLPRKSQKLLLLMIMRCNIPCKLTAGKVAVLSIETFCVFLKSSLSYFTLLRSV